ncbi:MAG: hypothetical protein JW791_02020 [Nanoarchaeota archaeon]|nr:hypothetical protein [Nanoarchaeota archaeon]
MMFGDKWTTIPLDKYTIMSLDDYIKEKDFFRVYPENYAEKRASGEFYFEMYMDEGSFYYCGWCDAIILGATSIDKNLNASCKVCGKYF